MHSYQCFDCIKVFNLDLTAQFQSCTFTDIHHFLQKAHVVCINLLRTACQGGV